MATINDSYTLKNEHEINGVRVYSEACALEYGLHFEYRYTIYALAPDNTNVILHRTSHHSVYESLPSATEIAEEVRQVMNWEYGFFASFPLYLKNTEMQLQVMKSIAEGGE